MARSVFSDAKARISRTLSNNFHINHQPRFHWWFRIIPVPTLQIVVLVLKTILRSMGVLIIALMYANQYMNALLSHGMYMIFGANTFTFSNNFIGDLLAFWGLQNSHFKAMVEWLYMQRIIHEPHDLSVKEVILKVVPYMFWSKFDILVASCGASCTGLTVHNDTFVDCQFQNETLVHGISNHLNQAGFSPQASSNLASATFLSVSIGAGLVTMCILCFSAVNVFNSPVLYGHLVPQAVASMWKGSSQIA